MDKEVLELLQSMQSDMKTIRKDINELKSKLDNNRLILEDINEEVGTIAEVQVSFTEQMERAKDKDGKFLVERLEVIELAITDTSGRVREIEKKYTKEHHE